MLECDSIEVQFILMLIALDGQVPDEGLCIILCFEKSNIWSLLIFIDIFRVRTAHEWINNEKASEVGGSFYGITVLSLEYEIHNLKKSDR